MRIQTQNYLNLNLDEQETKTITKLAFDITGIQINYQNHSVVYHNVIQRMLTTGCSSLVDYLSKVNQSEEELRYLISALTIHTTSWFREAGSFESLFAYFSKNMDSSKKIRALSIGCSTGEEVYSMAAVLDLLMTNRSIADYRIEGWDIDPISLRAAREGLYQRDSFKKIPEKYSNVINDRSIIKKSFSINTDIKLRCSFRAVNIFIPPSLETISSEGYDIIFCRNLLIYFSEDQINKVLDFCLHSLTYGGLMCVGSSETGSLSLRPFLRLDHGLFKSDTTKQERPSPPFLSTKTQTPVPNPTILIVEDERDISELLKSYILSFGYQAQECSSPNQALTMIKTSKFDLIITDFNLRASMDGLEFLEAAQKAGYKGKSIMVSGIADKDLAKKCSALGCYDVILKPFNPQELETMLASFFPKKAKIVKDSQKVDLVLLGASTGGPETLISLLFQMPKSSPPVMVVQHIEREFSLDFAKRLAQKSGLNLAKMIDGERIIPGHLYIATGDYHIGVRQIDQEMYLVLNHGPKIHSSRPSVDFLFRSIKKIEQQVFAALLTGMGRDGAEGLGELRKLGAKTYAQDEESCVVFGMPKEAIRIGAAEHILSIQKIRENLIKVC